jgi:hypothetical protein
MAYQETPLPVQESTEDLRWSVSNLLLTTLFVAATLPVGQADATALPKPRPSHLRTVVASRPSNQPDVVQKYDQTTLLYGPKRIVSWDPPNLLAATLAPVQAQAPFSQSDWAIPRSAARPVQRDHQYPCLALEPIVTRPVVPSEWPIPRGPAYPLVLRTSLDPLKLLLRGKDIFFTAPGMGPDYDWPNPLAKPYPHVLRTFTDSFKLPLLGKDKFFGPPGIGPDYDWPNPRVKPAAHGLTSWIQSKPTYYVDQVVVFPFSQKDWPLAQVRPPAMRPEAVQRNTTEPDSLAPSQQLTFLIGKKPAPPWEPPNLLVATLAPIVSANPFVQSDWPNPLQAKLSPISQRTFIYYYVYDDTAPFITVEWRNPQGTPFARELRTWVQGFQQALTPVGPKPFLLSEWPLPQPKTAILDLRTWAQARPTYYVEPGIPDGRLQDWPLPRGKTYPDQLRTWVDWRERVLVDPIPTGRLLDWPNPRPIPSASDLRHFLNTLIALPTGVVYPVTADIVVIARADDYVIRVTADDTVIQVKIDDARDRT